MIERCDWLVTHLGRKEEEEKQNKTIDNWGTYE